MHKVIKKNIALLIIFLLCSIGVIAQTPGEIVNIGSQYIVTNSRLLSLFLVLIPTVAFPWYFFATYYYSGASVKKGLILTVIGIIWTASLVFLTYTGYFYLKPWPRILIPITLTIGPAALIYFYRGWFLEKPLSQKWLVGINIFRFAGLVFILESIFGGVSTVLANIAGPGDLLTATIALIVIWSARNKAKLSNRGILTTIIVGGGDLGAAAFIAYTSIDNTWIQIFHITNDTTFLFPQGVIPIALVPILVAYHVLSLLSYLRDRGTIKIN